MKVKFFALAIILFAVVATGIFTKHKTYYHAEFAEAQTSAFFSFNAAYAYPPGVGILTDSPDCLTCHSNNGPWKDDENTIIDILDKDTKKSLRQSDGTFLIEAKKGELKTVLTVTGTKKNNTILKPHRTAWLFIDPATIGKNTLSKFAPGWEINLQMSCRLIGDNLAGYENDYITCLPVTISPTEKAQDTEISLQVMITDGEAEKNNAHEGLTGSYFEKKVLLKVK